jgi:acyl-CoA synthetase (AMP-forming)/AMP-acid ligase II
MQPSVTQQFFEATVIGIPDLKWSERPLLIAVKLAGEIIDEKMLLSYLGGKVAKWWVPENVVFVDELPHTATGKISKKDLRSQFANYIPK